MSDDKRDEPSDDSGGRGRSRWLVRVYLRRDRGKGKRRYHDRTVHGPVRDLDSRFRAGLVACSKNQHEQISTKTFRVSAGLFTSRKNAMRAPWEAIPGLHSHTHRDHMRSISRSIQLPIPSRPALFRGQTLKRLCPVCNFQGKIAVTGDFSPSSISARKVSNPGVSVSK